MYQQGESILFISYRDIKLKNYISSGTWWFVPQQNKILFGSSISIQVNSKSLEIETPPPLQVLSRWTYWYQVISVSLSGCLLSSLVSLRAKMWIHKSKKNCWTSSKRPLRPLTVKDLFQIQDADEVGVSRYKILGNLEAILPTLIAFIWSRLRPITWELIFHCM